MMPQILGNSVSAATIAPKLSAIAAGFALAFFVFAAADMVAAQTADRVGQATKVQGTATATNGDVSRALEVEAPIFKGDQLSTAEKSRLEITLLDNTLLTMGENATLKVNEFVFQDPAQRNTLQLFAVGAFKLVSGAINKPSAGNVQVITPIGALAVRGTDIWAGPIDGVYGVFLISGEVEVTTNAGSVTLTVPGSGTNIPSINDAPGPVTQWPQEKVDRALAAVAFQ